MKKRILAIALAVGLLVTCIGTSGLAASSASTVKKYVSGTTGGYLAIGDSMARGLGTDGYHSKNYGNYYNYDSSIVKGAYPYQIAKAVGCTPSSNLTKNKSNYWPVCYPGVTLAATMDLYGFDDGYTDEKDVRLEKNEKGKVVKNKYYYSNYKAMNEYYGYKGSIGMNNKSGYKGKVGSIIDLTKQASLITVGLGSCDVFYRPLTIATEGGSFNGDAIENIGTDNISEIVTTLNNEMIERCDYWEANYPILIQKMHDLNPKATIVMVGMFNILADAELTDNTVLPIGNIVSATTLRMNNKLKEWEKHFQSLGYDVRYADVANTESKLTEEDLSLLGGLTTTDMSEAIHPTQNGYNYMYRQVLSVLPEKTTNSKSTKKTTDIYIDLGRLQNVTYLTVNGRIFNDYEMDKKNPYLLKVYYGKENAQTLNIAVCENKKIAVQSYSLEYSADKGYSAYRIYGTNDLVAKTTRPAGLVLKSFKGLGNGFKSLFTE